MQARSSLAYPKARHAPAARHNCSSNCPGQGCISSTHTEEARAEGSSEKKHTVTDDHQVKRERSHVLEQNLSKTTKKRSRGEDGDHQKQALIKLVAEVSLHPLCLPQAWQILTAIASILRLCVGKSGTIGCVTL